MQPTPPAQGHFRQNWRTRWFVPREETLSYFRKREDANPAGVIRLKGCSLACLPPGEDSKHPWTIRLSTAEGVLYLIQAPDVQARDGWAHSIVQCIRSLDGSATPVARPEVEGVQVGTSTFSHYENSDIVQAMQDPSGGVPLETTARPTKATPHYFTGASLVEWLVKWSFACSRQDATALGNTLLQEGHIKMVNMQLLERSGSFSCCSSDQCRIVDSHGQFYIFALFAPPQPLELFQKDSDSDSDETEQLPCLMSEGKREWKPRRFVLSKDSDQLYFYRGSKGKYPLGSIPLRGSSIVVGAGESHSQSDSEEGQADALTLTVVTARGLMYHLQGATSEEMAGWHSALTQTIRTLDTTQEQ